MKCVEQNSVNSVDLFYTLTTMAHAEVYDTIMIKPRVPRIKHRLLDGNIYFFITKYIYNINTFAWSRYTLCKVHNLYV